jgi:hypothetical protein
MFNFNEILLSAFLRLGALAVKKKIFHNDHNR